MTLDLCKVVIFLAKEQIILLYYGMVEYLFMEVMMEKKDLETCTSAA
jgi:hypothetical protein